MDLNYIYYLHQDRTREFENVSQNFQFGNTISYLGDMFLAYRNR